MTVQVVPKLVNSWLHINEASFQKNTILAISCFVDKNNACLEHSFTLFPIQFRRCSRVCSLFWTRFGSGFKCIVTKRKSASLLTLTYYFEATVTPAGISSYFPGSLFITVHL